MANTLLSYFKDNLKKEHASTKHFNRDFLGVFCKAYNDIKRQDESESGIIYTTVNGITTAAAWLPVYETKFYKDNGGSYCVFLELWTEYRTAMDKLTAAGW